jgi:hypothetical protein
MRLAKERVTVHRATLLPGPLVGSMQWAMPWASVLLVSCALAYAMNAAITGGVSASGSHVLGEPAASLVAQRSPAEPRNFRMADRHDSDASFSPEIPILADE